MKICSFHKVEADWKEGIGKVSKKAYAFWACPQKLQDGNYCKAEIIDGEGVNPSSVREFEASLKETRSERIERQHSQEMALRFVDLLIKTDKLTGIDKRLSDLVKEYTDWFQKDLDPSSAQAAEAG